MAKRKDENNEEILVNQFLLTSNIADISKKTGMSRSTIYKIMNTDSFQEKLQDARKQAVDNTINVLQGNLSACAEVLVNIAKNEDEKPQIRINACNAVFLNMRYLTSENEKMAEMAVRIYDTI